MNSSAARVSILLAVLAGLVASGGCTDKNKAAAAQRQRALRREQMARSDSEALTGRWQLVYAVVNGEVLPDEQLHETQLIVDHSAYRVVHPQPQQAADSTPATGPRRPLTIDPTKRPKHVDCPAGGGAGKATHGIYQVLDANNVRVCYAPPGDPRPDDFSAPLGSQRTLQYWRLIDPQPQLGSGPTLP